ncbi:MAG: hypothetical protein CFE32_14515 [Alphaproteobacteria bacterium PA3]|nr:MAG: hypothetical protein CFE32_14515 [Alphaproteobacteria bacterium PA3]
MILRIQRLLLGAAFLTFSVGPALADSPSAASTDPMVAYRAYDQAVAEGKLAEAAVHAQEAWKRAETTWGPTNPNTAGLAFNAAWSLALVRQAANGVEAANRAVELADIGAKAYQKSEAQFLLAFAEFEAANEGDKYRRIMALDKTAKAIEGSWRDMLVADALTKASMQATLDGDSERGEILSARALREVNRLGPQDRNRLAIAYLASAMAKALDGRKIGAAYEEIIQARVLYGRMRQVDDPTWGALSAWQAAIRSKIGTTTSVNGGPGLRLLQTPIEPRSMTAAEMAKVFDARPDCSGIPRFKRKSGGQDVKLRLLANPRIDFAAVHVRMDLASDGQILNVRLLGATPKPDIAISTLKSIATWSFEVPPNTPPTCLKDFDWIFTYSWIDRIPQ